MIVLRRWWRWGLPVLLAAGAVLFRAERLTSPPVKVFDEGFYTFTGRQFLNGDQLVYDTGISWVSGKGLYARYHPPLGSLLIGFSIKLLGDRPIGWRFFSVLAAAAAAVGVYLFTWTLTGSRLWSVVVYLLYESDFLTFIHGRVGGLDIFLLVFVISASLLFLKLYQNRKANYVALIILGVILGLGLSVKWSAVLTLLPLTALLIIKALRVMMESRRTALFLFGGSLAVPSVALLVYLSIFAVFVPPPRLLNMVKIHQRIIDYHTFSYSQAVGGLKLNQAAARSWWRWPFDLKPSAYFSNLTFTVSRTGSKFSGNVINAYGNPLLYWALVPASLWLLFFSYRRGSLSTLGLPALLFFANWIPWAFSPRPTFWFYFLPAVPFGTISLGIALKRLWDKGFKFPVGAYVFSVIVLFFILYPTFTAMTIPDKVFRFLDRIFGPMS